MNKTRMQLSDVASDKSEITVKCPNCGSEYLTHGSVHIFNRREDSKEGVHFKIAANNCELDGDMLGNPSSRRHGLLIQFSCEGCDAGVFMCVAQQKGLTTVWMEHVLQ